MSAPKTTIIDLAIAIDGDALLIDIAPLLRALSAHAAVKGIRLLPKPGPSKATPDRAEEPARRRAK